MNVNANRLELLRAVRQAALVAPNASPLEVLKGILLKAESNGHLYLSATNLEVAIRIGLPCVSESEDAVVVNARLLVGMLERLGGESVMLSRNDSSLQLTVKSEKAFYQIPILGGDCFPQIEMPFPEDTIPVKGLPKMVKRIAFAVDKTNNEKPMLRCVNLMFTKDGLKAAGSDGHCVATARGDANSTGDIAMMVPAASLGTLARISSDKDEFRVGTTGKSIVFMKKDLFFSARILDGEYIDTDKLIARLTNRFTVLADMEELRDTLYSTVSIDPDGTLMLGFDGNLLYTRCDSEYAKAVNSMNVIPLTGTPKGEYWYRSRQLMECLRVTEGMTTIGVAQNGLLTVSTENSYYFQSPVRAPATVRKAPDPAPKAA